jgi:nitrite reductase/ring-hydroxylating ferredoxin subunit
MEDNEFNISEVPPGSALLVEAGGESIAVFNVGGVFYATQAECTHKRGPLDEGELDGSIVTCPYHGAQYDVSTGQVLRGPAEKSLRTFRVEVDGAIGRVQV